MRHSASVRRSVQMRTNVASFPSGYTSAGEQGVDAGARQSSISERKETKSMGLFSRRQRDANYRNGAVSGFCGETLYFPLGVHFYFSCGDGCEGNRPRSGSISPLACRPRPVLPLTPSFPLAPDFPFPSRKSSPIHFLPPLKASFVSDSLTNPSPFSL